MPTTRITVRNVAGMPHPGGYNPYRTQAIQAASWRTGRLTTIQASDPNFCLGSHRFRRLARPVPRRRCEL
ncbi:MAG: hypothetical protein ACRDZ7_17310 [Acidimicrobiia bacterium]